MSFGDKRIDASYDRWATQTPEEYYGTDEKEPKHKHRRSKENQKAFRKYYLKQYQKKYRKTEICKAYQRKYQKIYQKALSIIAKTYRKELTTIMQNLKQNGKIK